MTFNCILLRFEHLFLLFLTHVPSFYTKVIDSLNKINKIIK